jgi:hypothetical protein
MAVRPPREILTHIGLNLSSFMKESLWGRFGLAPRANAALRHAWAGVLAVTFRIELLLDPSLPVWCYFDKPIPFFWEGRQHPTNLGGNKALRFWRFLSFLRRISGGFAPHFYTDLFNSTNAWSGHTVCGP